MKTADSIAVNDRDRCAIDAAAKLLRERFPVEEVVLYGSKARGTDDAESDIDLLVLTSRPLSWRERRAVSDALFDLQLEHDVLISSLVVPGREWREGLYRVLPIHEEIERDGLPV